MKIHQLFPVGLGSLALALALACGGSGSSSSSGSTTTTTPVTTPTVLPQLSLYVTDTESNYSGIAVDTVKSSANYGDVYLQSQVTHGYVYSQPISLISSSKVFTQNYGTLANFPTVPGRGAFCAGVYTDPTTGNLYASIVTDTGVGEVCPVSNSGVISQTHMITFSDFSDEPNYGVISTSGNLYVCGNTSVYEVSNLTSSPVVTRLATNYTFTLPQGITLDSSDNVYVADGDAHVIVEIDHSSGNGTVLAGVANTASYVNGAALTATFNAPLGLAMSADNNLLYIADSGNNVIRVLNMTTKMVSTIQSTTTTGDLAINSASAATANQPVQLYSIAFNTDGNLLIQGGAATGETEIFTWGTGKSMETSVYLLKL